MLDFQPVEENQLYFKFYIALVLPKEENAPWGKKIK